MTITFVAASAAGSGPSGNNTSLVPTLPTGAAAGDLIIIKAAIRNVGTGTVNTPAGWTLMTPAGNFVLLGRFWQTGDTMPTVTFTGGAAGADTSVATMALRGVSPDSLAPVQAKLTNVSAQNVALPALGVASYGDNRLVISAGWKQSIATTWDTPAGFTSLGLTNAAAGTGMSMKWSYLLQTAGANVPASSAVLVGGVAAVSQGVTVALRAAASLTAAVQNVYPPRVLLTATGLDIGSGVTIWRVVAGQRTAVRGVAAVAGLATTLVVVDAEIPFGVPVSYVLTIVTDDSVTASVTYTLPGGNVAITDAVTGLAAEVRLLAWPEQARNAVASVFVVDRKNIVVNGGIGQYQSSIDVFTETTAGANMLQSVLNSATAGVVQIRQPGGYDGVDGYLAVLGASKKRFSQDGSDQRRTWTLDVVEVDAWASSLLGRGFTYQDVINKYAGLTYAQWSAAYATYLLAQQGDYS